MHRTPLLLLLLLLSSLASCAQPMPRAVTAQGSRVYLPLTLAHGYVWPSRGFGHPPEAWAISHAALIGGAPVWFYDWWWDCSRWLNDAGLYVPSVARAWYPQVMACNDGRPLLVLNEPEEVGQAELTPEAAAAVLHEAAASGWSGPIYCCGVQAAHIPYMRQVVAVYQSQYGAWPADGLHVHVYHGADELAEFIAWARAQGVLGDGVVVSEYGRLTDEKLTSGDLETLTAQVLAVDGVLTAAWFSVNYPPWAASDLLTAGGALTELGEAWRN